MSCGPNTASTAARCCNQQDPIPEGGAIFQREWFSHRFRRDPVTGLPLGAKLRMVIQSWDTAAKKKEANDFWACTTWGLVVGEDARIRMLDRTMDRMEYVEGRQRVKDQYAKWKDTTAVLIEDSSSGTAIISDLRTTGSPSCLSPRPDRIKKQTRGRSRRCSRLA
jgi:phage terminase large subunit-like protein